MLEHPIHPTSIISHQALAVVYYVFRVPPCLDNDQHFALLNAALYCVLHEINDFLAGRVRVLALAVVHVVQNKPPRASKTVEPTAPHATPGQRRILIPSPLQLPLFQTIGVVPHIVPVRTPPSFFVRNDVGEHFPKARVALNRFRNGLRHVVGGIVTGASNATRQQRVLGDEPAGLDNRDPRRLSTRRRRLDTNAVALFLFCQPQPMMRCRLQTKHIFPEGAHGLDALAARRVNALQRLKPADGFGRHGVKIEIRHLLNKSVSVPTLPVFLPGTIPALCCVSACCTVHRPARRSPLQTARPVSQESHDPFGTA